MKTPFGLGSTRRSSARRASPGWRTGTGSAASSAAASWIRWAREADRPRFRRWLLRGDVRAGQPAVDEEGRGGDVGALVGGEEERALSDLARLREAAHRQMHHAAGGLLRILRE